MAAWEGIVTCPLCGEEFPGNPVSDAIRRASRDHYKKHNWLRRKFFELLGL